MAMTWVPTPPGSCKGNSSHAMTTDSCSMSHNQSDMAYSLLELSFWVLGWKVHLCLCYMRIYRPLTGQYQRQRKGLFLCRFEMALSGWCNEECEDQLQHLISVHLGARESAWHHADFRKALKHHPSQAAADDEDLGHMHTGLFLHTRLASLFKQYAAARRLSRIEWMSHTYDTSDPPV